MKKIQQNILLLVKTLMTGMINMLLSLFKSVVLLNAYFENRGAVMEIGEHPLSSSSGSENRNVVAKKLETDSLKIEIPKHLSQKNESEINGVYALPKTKSFVTVWRTGHLDNGVTNQIVVPTMGSGYDYLVDWGDGYITKHSDADASTSAKHTYKSAGLYTVRIYGAFPRIHFGNKGDKDKITAVYQWGDIKWISMENAFFGCSNLQILAMDVPDLSEVSSMANMFRNASSFNNDIAHWDVSKVANMSHLFSGTAFNQNINNWDVGNVKNMDSMFCTTASFNQPLNTWDVRQVTNMEAMFIKAFSFNQDLSNWKVDNVEDMGFMFYDASAFNQNIDNWNVGNVDSMCYMFNGASAFNQPLDSWCVANVQNMGGMFAHATSFNQDLSQWDVCNVVYFDGMFRGALSFDQNLKDWNLCSAKHIHEMFLDTNISDENLKIILQKRTKDVKKSVNPFIPKINEVKPINENREEDLNKVWAIVEGQ